MKKRFDIGICAVDTCKKEFMKRVKDSNRFLSKGVRRHNAVTCSPKCSKIHHDNLIKKHYKITKTTKIKIRLKPSETK